jgi:hypothetical protein
MCMKWYEAKVPELIVGAEAGDPDAMYHLAQRYRKGREVPQDLPRALEWFLRAADLGHAHAQSSMGVRYYYGEGVPKNHRLAMKWYLAGAAKKEPEALYNMGDLFDDSDEIPKNPIETCAWMLVAAAYGYRSAMDRLDPLVKPMSPENLDRAARRGAQIFARCEAGQPLDPSPAFREAHPLPAEAPAPDEVGLSRLSLLGEFAYLCKHDKANRLLTWELVHGEAKVFVRGRLGSQDLSDPCVGPGGLPRGFDGVESLKDGRVVVMAYTDPARVRVRHRTAPWLTLPSFQLVEAMDMLNATIFMLNPGSESLFSIMRKDPAHG